jgi:hypothetical protein
MINKSLTEMLAELPMPKFSSPAYKIGVADNTTYKNAEIMPIYENMRNNGHYVAKIE